MRGQHCMVRSFKFRCQFRFWLRFQRKLIRYIRLWFRLRPKPKNPVSVGLYFALSRSHRSQRPCGLHFSLALIHPFRQDCIRRTSTRRDEGYTATSQHLNNEKVTTATSQAPKLLPVADLVDHLPHPHNKFGRTSH